MGWYGACGAVAPIATANPPGADDIRFRFGWLKEGGATPNVLGPPIALPPPATDVQTWSRMAGRVKSCPSFPGDFKSMSYREWRISLCHWVWGMRTQMVAENFLITPFMEALKDGAGGVHKNILMVDPRILRNPGRPRGTWGAGDGGQLSGVVWYVECILDVAHKHPLTGVEDGLNSVEEYYKIDRAGRPTVTLTSELDRAYNEAMIRGDFWLSEAGRTRRLFDAMHLSPKERGDLLLKVDGDPTRYETIKALVKAVYPNDKTMHFNNAFADGGDGAEGSRAAPPPGPTTPPHSYSTAGYRARKLDKRAMSSYRS